MTKRGLGEVPQVALPQVTQVARASSRLGLYLSRVISLPVGTSAASGSEPCALEDVYQSE